MIIFSSKGIFFIVVVLGLFDQRDALFNENEISDETVDDVPRYPAVEMYQDRPDTESLLRVLLVENGFYDPKRQRLLSENGSTLNVSLTMKIVNIIEIDEYKGTVSIGVFVGLDWIDFRLKWNLSMINLHEFPVESKDVNPPDVVLLNSYDLKELRPFTPTKALLHSDGRIIWTPRGTLTVGCHVDAKFWPFTFLRCDYKFGVPSHPDQNIRLYLRHRHAVLDEYSETNKWNISNDEMISEQGNPYGLRGSNQGLPSEIYGKIQPKIRLLFERKSNNFLTSIFVGPAVLIVLFGLSFALTSSASCNYVITLVGLTSCLGIRVTLSAFMPTSTDGTRSPVIGIVFADAVYLFGYLLIANFVVERMSLQQRPPPRIITRIRNLKGHQYSVNNCAISDEWKFLARIFKGFFVVVYFMLAGSLFGVTLLPTLSSETRKNEQNSIFSSNQL